MTLHKLPKHAKAIFWFLCDYDYDYDEDYYYCYDYS